MSKWQPPSPDHNFSTPPTPLEKVPYSWSPEIVDERWMGQGLVQSRFLLWPWWLRVRCRPSNPSLSWWTGLKVPRGTFNSNPRYIPKYPEVHVPSKVLHLKEMYKRYVYKVIKYKRGGVHQIWPKLSLERLCNQRRLPCNPPLHYSSHSRRWSSGHQWY